MIKIKMQYNGNYILGIDQEEWKLESRKEIEEVLKLMLDLKEKHGRINNE